MKVSAQNMAMAYDELASAVERGEEVEISYENRPTIHLVPVQKLESKPRVITMAEMFGIFRDELHMAPDWDSHAMNDEIAEEFENGVVFPAIHP